MAGRKKPKAGLPSRQDILDYISENPDHTTVRHIISAFDVAKKYRARLRSEIRHLKDMGLIEDGDDRPLSRTGALPPVTVVRVSGTDSDGEVLVTPDNRPNDQPGDRPAPLIYLKADRRPGPAPGIGDRLLVRLRQQDDGDYQARLIRALPGGSPLVIGVYDGDARVKPTDRKARSELEIGPGDSMDAEAGELVVAELVRHGSRYGLRQARIVRRIGRFGAAETFSRAALGANDIPVEFAPEALALAEAAVAAPPDGRADLRAVPLVTIDDEDARDFDDAVFAEPDADPENPGGWKLIVAIADVARYVRPDDALDQAARERGNSVYLPDQVVPMLPEALSNGWCSLRPGEDRPCLAAHIRIGADGRILEHRFERALMRSAARLTYRRVHDTWNGNPDEECTELTGSVLEPLRGAFAALENERNRREPLNLDLPERRVVFENAESWRVEERPRYVSHRLIESFMITANVAAARTLAAKRTPALFRVHDEPPADKLAGLTETLRAMGHPTPKGRVLLPHHFNRILANASDNEEADLLADLVLRSQAQAVYSASDDGHFGLHLRNYTHFTSPIRRYADLVVHRALIKALKLGDDGEFPPSDRLNDLAAHVSMTERRAVSAEREAMDRFAVAAALNVESDRLAGRVTGITRFGLYVELENGGAEGFIPKRLLGAGRLSFDEKSQSLGARRGGLRYSLGQTLAVTIKEADPLRGRLILQPIDSE